MNRMSARLVPIAVAVILIGCSQEADDTQGRVQAQPASQPARDTAAAMDHAAHTDTNMKHDSAGMRSTTNMPGMDHGNMPMSNAPPAASHEGMQHGTGGAATQSHASMQRMNHARMPRGEHTAAHAPSGVQQNANVHAAHQPTNATPTPAADTAATSKLKKLVNALLQDTVVRARAASDTTVLRRWSGGTTHRGH